MEHALTLLSVLTGACLVSYSLSSCDLSLPTQCNCTSDLLLGAYNISCEGRVTGSLIPAENSTQLIKIQHLDLSSNQMEGIPENLLQGISEVSILDLSNNSLTDIPAAVFMPGLSIGELCLGYNMIRSLNVSHLYGLTNMSRLVLSNNNITEVKGRLSKYTSVTIPALDLSFNQLIELDTTQLFYMREVHSLDLSHNSLRTLDIFPSMLIKHLNLSYNRLSDLAERIFQHMTHLQELNLANNNFQHAEPQWFTGLQSLTTLDLSHNNISQLASMMLKNLPRIHTLDLGHNQLAKVGSQEFTGVKSPLKVLNLGFNHISAVEKFSFTWLEHLTSLTLATNHRLSSLYQVQLPPHLAFLDLTNCSISELYACDFSHLVDLKYLHLQGNNLTCDCHMTWLLQWWQDSMDKDLRIQTQMDQPWTCKVQDSLLNFHTFPAEELVCHERAHKLAFCESNPQPDYQTNVNDTDSIPMAEDIDLQMNTTTDSESVICRWSVSSAYPIYGFKFVFSGSEDGVKVSPWIHRSQREYVMNDILSYTNYNVCINAYHNQTLLITTACDSIYVISYKVYVGIMAGMLAIIPCFVALLIVMWKDRGASKYEPLIVHVDSHSKKGIGLGRGFMVTSTQPSTGAAVNHFHRRASEGKSSNISQKEIDSYINQSFAFADESSYNSRCSQNKSLNSQHANGTSEACGTKPKGNDSSLSVNSIDPNIQCCDVDHSDFSTRL